MSYNVSVQKKNWFEYPSDPNLPYYYRYLNGGSKVLVSPSDYIRSPISQAVWKMKSNGMKSLGISLSHL